MFALQKVKLETEDRKKKQYHSCFSIIFCFPRKVWYFHMKK